MDLHGGMESTEKLADTEPKKIPFIGMKFETEIEAFEFYNNYGGTLGFSVRRDSVHKDKVDVTIIRSRRFVCNKAGTRLVDKRENLVKKPRAETRVNCPAKMCISRTHIGDYVCREFVPDHNHELHHFGVDFTRESTTPNESPINALTLSQMQIGRDDHQTAAIHPPPVPPMTMTNNQEAGEGSSTAQYVTNAEFQSFTQRFEARMDVMEGHLRTITTSQAALGRNQQLLQRQNEDLIANMQHIFRRINEMDRSCRPSPQPPQ